MKKYTLKLSGKLLEVTEQNALAKPHNRNDERKSIITALYEGQLDEIAIAQQLKVQAHSIANTIRNFKRLLFANFPYGYTFLTLTFDKKNCDFDITDAVTCRTKFTNFWKNLKRGTKDEEYLEDDVDLRYLGVQEYHKDGSIHFHILCHIPRHYKDLLKKKWVHGNLDLKRSKKNPLDIQKIDRYLKKGIFDPRLNNEKHRYLTSLGLNKTKVFNITAKNIASWINNDNSRLLYQEDSEYGFNYYQYLTKLTEDDIKSYADSVNENELQFYIEQLELIQQLQPIA